MHFNSVEFDGIKTGIMKLLPDTKEFNSITVAKPVPDQIIRTIGISVACNIGKRNIIRFMLRNDGYGEVGTLRKEIDGE